MRRNVKEEESMSSRMVDEERGLALDAANVGRKAAFLASIQHWERLCATHYSRIYDAGTEVLYADACAICVFSSNKATANQSCCHCCPLPAHESTDGMTNADMGWCNAPGSFWHQARNALMAYQEGNRYDTTKFDAWTRTAKAMLWMLKARWQHRYHVPFDQKADNDD